MSGQGIIVIVGPTAGGKSELAVGVALGVGGEIINADSMQVYRHLNAGTAKPTAEQRAAVRHHLIDCVEPKESWTVADWLAAAERLIGEMGQRGVRPIVVGGTNLYLKALLEGMFDGPGANAALRARLAELEAGELHERLAAVDAAAAARIDRHDHKRLVRALEVWEATGRPISEQQRQWEGAGGGHDEGERKYRHDPVLIGLRWSVEGINRRINARVKGMFERLGAGAGGEDLVAETRRLEAAGLLGAGAREALGTKQVLAHLRGECGVAEAMERVKIDTRRFAKSQRTWLKRYRQVHWIEAEQSDPAERLKRALEVAGRAEPGKSEI